MSPPSHFSLDDFSARWCSALLIGAWPSHWMTDEKDPITADLPNPLLTPREKQRKALLHREIPSDTGFKKTDKSRRKKCLSNSALNCLQLLFTPNVDILYFLFYTISLAHNELILSSF